MYLDKRIICLIPARGGSLGLPGKNIRQFGGLPMIAHNILKARSLPEIDMVVVSTDSPEIADVSRYYGASVPFLRCAALAKADTPMAPVIVDAVERLLSSDLSFDVAIMLQANSPLLKTNDIMRVLTTIVDRELDVVFTVAATSHPPQWSLRLEEDEPCFAFLSTDDPVGVRRQDQELLYRSTGAVFAVTVKHLLENPYSVRLCLPATGQRSGVVVTDRLSSIDIDSEDDFRIAEALFLTRDNGHV